VTIPARPQRIVGIFASNVEILAAMGAGPRLVGIEDYTRFPPELVKLPKVGGRLGFSVDAVVGLKPDLLVVTPAREAAHTLVDPMERLGIPVVVVRGNERALKITDDDDFGRAEALFRVVE